MHLLSKYLQEWQVPVPVGDTKTPICFSYPIWSGALSKECCRGQIIGNKHNNWVNYIVH